MPVSLDIKINGQAAAQSPSSVSFNKGPPRVLLASDTANFDPASIRNFRNEGYQISYYPYDGDRKGFANYILHVADPLQLGERFAIVGMDSLGRLVCDQFREIGPSTDGELAYGKAAAAALDICMKPVSKLCALAAYYPTSLPKTATGFPPTLKVCVHIAGDQDSLRHPQKYRSYSYPHARSGFAEKDSDGEGGAKFDLISANLAWTRTLECVRDGFGIKVDVEGVWERHLAQAFVHRDVEGTLESMADEGAYVSCVPTNTGARGKPALQRFFRDSFFVRPASTKTRLISRTIGTDRVVDEMLLSFEHECEVPWMLPGVQPTGRHVEVVVLLVATVRGGKVEGERLYWDQAGVRAQVGLGEEGGFEEEE